MEESLKPKSSMIGMPWIYKLFNGNKYNLTTISHTILSQK